MDYQIIWSDHAQNQLDEIFEFIRCNAKNANIAKRVIQKILLTPNILKANPRLGQKEVYFESLKTEYRYIISSNYKIIYFVNDEKLEITISDVFDVRQNPSNIFRNK